LSERKEAAGESRALAPVEVGPTRVRLLNVGYGNRIAASRIVAIVAPGASPMRRLRRDATERGKLVDATDGRRTRSILVLASAHVVLSAINPETLAGRLGDARPDDAA
jgi:regulator of extracellular matrix RemA (YlzA/DUF370 family)